MADEPLSLAIRDAPARPGTQSCSFVFSSRGDRVPGRSWSPDADDTAQPVVLIGHGAGGAKDSTWLDAVAQRWVAQGLAVAAIDLPLHGERTDAKLHDLLLDELTGRRSGLGLAGDFLQQASSDLSRAVSAIAEIPGVDPQRVAFAGFGVGAVAGIRGCADDSRLRAAALALPVGTSAAWLGDSTEPGRAFAPRPTLLVDASEDETAPADAEAAMSDFLAKQLGVGTPD